MEMQFKKIITIFGILLLSTFLVTANGHHESEIEEGKKLVESKINCDRLNDEQLEAIGDYYMEEMHPGKAHELMHDMMGGHDSSLVKEMHINMAKGIYCNEDVGMMNMMASGNGMMSGGMMGNNMMDGGMMNMMGEQTSARTNRMQGMMGNNYYQTPQNNNTYQNNFFGFQIFFYVILTLIIIVLSLVIMLLVNKSKNSSKQKVGNVRK